MKHPCLAVSCLACAVLGSAPCIRAESGTIVFTGAIVEQACPLRHGTLDCPSGHQVGAVIRPLDIASARRQLPAGLFAYALARDRAATWQVIDITYR
ncbi:hypothetical protein [Luteibacter sp. dw_328]|uniref:hypothetical protein n=1 Tax=Luteibacter sp. dw_328 TaxID=2719796 RepID=UPI001BD58EB3|nr:hypothetical protein [Luteibacter sp. dw_328]